MKKLMADTIIGIIKVDEFDVEPISEQLFIACLDDLSEGEIICAEVHDYTYKLIEETYGIRK